MQDAPEPDVGSLRFLKTLVTTLTVVMICGFIVLIGLLVTQFGGGRGGGSGSGGGGGDQVALPDAITLPDGATPVAFTQAADWYAVVTAQDRILIYDRETGALAQEITVNVQN